MTAIGRSTSERPTSSSSASESASAQCRSSSTTSSPPASAHLLERGRDLLEEPEPVVPAPGPGGIAEVLAIREDAELPEDLGPRPVARRAQAVDGPAPRGPGEERRDSVGDMGNQRGLADPRLARHQHQRPVASARVGQRGAQQRGRLLATDQRRRRPHPTIVRLNGRLSAAARGARACGASTSRRPHPAEPGGRGEPRRVRPHRARSPAGSPSGRSDSAFGVQTSAEQA